jgi:hypothetical protein
MSDRQAMILRELKQYDEMKSDATYPIDFRGERKYLPLIRVQQELLILNHKNNRLSGQLLDHPKKEQIEANPELVDSQKELIKVLAQTERFKELKDQLKVLGQREPGLITREGLIINGNTRVAAMRELGMQYVDVAVLPDNVNEADILEIEMNLQVTDLVHQDYTFTNELLLMRKFLLNGGSEKDLAKKMGWIKRGENKVNLHMRLLDYIEEIRGLSKTPLPYSVFDNKKQHLKDLDDDYSNLKNEGDIDAAESLKWTRLSMIFLGLNKDQVRAMDDEFIDNQLLRHLTGDENQESLKYIEKYRSASVSDGLDDLLGTQDTKTIDMRKFLQDFLNDDSMRDSSGDVSIDANDIFSTIQWNARRASDNLIDAKKVEKGNTAPSETLKEIRLKLQDLRLELPEKISASGFNQGKFKYDLKKVHDELEKIDQLLKD